VQVMNLGVSTAHVELQLRDEFGEPFAGCGDACRGAIGPLLARTWPLAGIDAVPAGAAVSAIIDGDQPLAAAVLDLPLATGDLDASSAFAAPETDSDQPADLWLPLFLSRSCPTAPLDIALVVDASTSMSGPRMDATRIAFLGFLGAMDLDGADQAALVTFHSTAQLLVPLGHDGAALAAAFGQIQTSAGSRLDLGIALAHQELISPRHVPGHGPVLVALTDGRVAPVGVDVAIAAAEAAKAAGIRVIMIALGPDVDTDGLRTMASAASDYYTVPDEQHLNAALGEIASRLRCP
jgi:uncharacterized protein YegL